MVVSWPLPQASPWAAGVKPWTQGQRPRVPPLSPAQQETGAGSSMLFPAEPPRPGRVPAGSQWASHSQRSGDASCPGRLESWASGKGREVAVFPFCSDLSEVTAARPSLAPGQGARSLQLRPWHRALETDGRPAGPGRGGRSGPEPPAGVSTRSGCFPLHSPSFSYFSVIFVGKEGSIFWPSVAVGRYIRFYGFVPESGTDRRDNFPVVTHSPLLPC